jgi:hypothetical protein
MHEDHRKNISFESHFNIDKMSFDNVNSDFERKFKKLYDSSLNRMSDDRDPLSNASGANSLGILEKMAQQLYLYDRNSDFEQSYREMLEEYEPFNET